MGRRRLVSDATDTPLFGPLRDLLSKVYGVPAVTREGFGHLDARVVVVSSWAARWSGPDAQRRGRPVIGDVDPTDAWDAASRATSRLGIEVDVVVRDQHEWRRQSPDRTLPIEDVHPVLDPLYRRR